MKKILLPLTLVLLLTLSLTACDQKKAAREAEKMMNTSEHSMMGDDKMDEGEWSEEEMEAMEMEDDAMMEDKESEAMMEDDKMEASASASYEPYSLARFNEIKGKQPVVISFHADWCPNCRALEKNIKASIDELPKNAVILVANYDNETELKKEYGITVQTTLVFFDSAGEKIATEYNPSLEEIKDLLSS